MINKEQPKLPRKEFRAEALPTTEATIFDGKGFSAEREKILMTKVKELKSLGVQPKLVAIITHRHPSSQLYVRLKQKAAERIGIEMEVFEVFSSGRDYHYLLNLIGAFNRDATIHGIMIQLPLALRFLAHQEKILNAIVPEKDVDGLRNESPFVPATVKAIITIIEEASQKVLLRKPPHVFVVGSEGAVGKALINQLKKQGYNNVEGFDKKPLADWRDLWGVPSFMSLKADVVVSATGTPGLIESRHIAKNAVVIDVGSPEGDVRFKEVKTKASFVTPVPGGVGPVTIVSLLENTVVAAYNTLSVI